MTSLRTPDTTATLAAFISRVAVFAAGVDCVYFLFFSAIGSSLLAWINLVSVAIYTLAYFLVTRRRLHLAVMLIWLEVFPHAVIGTLMLGWESGFHYLPLMFIPSVVMTNSRRQAQVFIVGMLVFLFTLDAVARHLGALAPISNASLIAIKWLNITLFIAMFSALASYYRQKIGKVEKRLQTLATQDPLTGLHNRRHFQPVAEREMARTLRSGGNSCLIIMDIDFFKPINDNYGHEAGDLVLVAVSRLLRKNLRDADTLARWGGEEFVVLMPDAQGSEAMTMAERIRRAVEACPVSYQGCAIHFTMSFGVTQFKPGDTLNTVIARADQALYQSKAEGRNRITRSTG
jgi:diguanylate cyclase (GGDEF)-like protein